MNVTQGLTLPEATAPDGTGSNGRSTALTPSSVALLALTVALLAGALAMPWLVPVLRDHPPATLMIVVVTIGTVVLTAARSAHERQRDRAAGTVVAPAGGRPRAGQLALHLTPVLLLTVVYPIASRSMLDTTVGGAPLTALILCASLAMPWLSHGVSMPLYSALGPLLLAGDRAAIARQFWRVWPATFVVSLPTVLIYAVPVRLATGWSGTAIYAFIALCALNVLFSQALVITNTGGRRGAWACSWTLFAAAVWFWPTAWWLPPLLGTLPALFLLRRQLRRMPVLVNTSEVGRDIARGLALGSVLWADKLLLFLVIGPHFPVDTLFLALLPAIITYNVYFVCLAPRFDSSVASLRHAMENSPAARLGPYSRGLASTVTGSVVTSAAIGAAMVFTVSWVLVDLRPAYGPFAVGVALASWTFAMVTVVCYKIDYAGRRRTAQQLSLAVLGATTALFLTLPAGPGAYLAAAAAAALVLLVALRACAATWRRPEYTFFWRHAMAW